MKLPWTEAELFFFELCLLLQPFPHLTSRIIYMFLSVSFIRNLLLFLLLFLCGVAQGWDVPGASLFTAVGLSRADFTDGLALEGEAGRILAHAELAAAQASLYQRINSLFNYVAGRSLRHIYRLRSGRNCKV